MQSPTMKGLTFNFTNFFSRSYWCFSYGYFGFVKLKGPFLKEFAQAVA